MEDIKIIERGQTGPGQKPRRRWTPDRILFVTFLLLALIAGLATAGIYFLLLNTALALYIAAPLAFVVLLAGLYLAYRSSSSPSSTKFIPLDDPSSHSERRAFRFSSQSADYGLAPKEEKVKKPRIVLIGVTQAGKSAFAERYLKDEFFEYIQPTIGATFFTSEKIEGTKLEIWDTSGVARYDSFLPLYYRNASGIMIMYDITNHESFKKAQAKIGELRKAEDFPESAKIMLVGCKSDLVDQRQVTAKEAQAYAKAQGLEFAETSAKTGAGVKEAFEKLRPSIRRRLVKTTLQ